MKTNRAFFYLHLVLLCFNCTNDNTSKKIKQTIPDASQQVKTAQKDIPGDYINATGATIKERVGLPKSFQRIDPSPKSFGYYLQNFPLKPHQSKVYYHNGNPKYTQDYHLAVLDIDTGKRDL